MKNTETFQTPSGLSGNRSFVNIIFSIFSGIVIFLFLIMVGLGSGTLFAKAYALNNPTSKNPVIQTTQTPFVTSHLSEIDENSPILEVFETPSSHDSGDPAQPAYIPTQRPSPTRNPTLTPRTSATRTFTPTSTDVPQIRIPVSARISGIYGQSQAFSLDCEARSAVDWATHFGISINEKEFFNRLPINDNPDKGFSGSVDGYWGLIPPGPYGIHAEPVAQLLRVYGAKAMAVRGYQYEQIQREISSGRPVIAWIVGKVWSGKPLEYIANDGSIVTVAKYEHTIIVIGYNSTDVTILDGANTYKREINQFRDSWSVLNNMAIIWKN